MLFTVVPCCGDDPGCTTRMPLDSLTHLSTPSSLTLKEVFFTAEHKNVDVIWRRYIIFCSYCTFLIPRPQLHRIHLLRAYANYIIFPGRNHSLYFFYFNIWSKWTKKRMQCHKVACICIKSADLKKSSEISLVGVLHCICQSVVSLENTSVSTVICCPCMVSPLAFQWANSLDCVILI